MLKHALNCASLLVLLSTTAAAQEAGGYYSALKLVGGVSSMDVSLDGESSGFSLFDDAPELVGGPALAIGYQMKTFPVRMELEWIWRYRFDMDGYSNDSQSRVFKSNVGTHSLMWNAYYDVPLTERLFTKGTAFGYVGAGIGGAYTTAETTIGYSGQTALQEQSESTLDITWMATIGMRYKVTPSWVLDVSYRYSDLGGIDTGSSALGTVVSDNYTSHDLVIGIAYGW